MKAEDEDTRKRSDSMSTPKKEIENKSSNRKEKTENRESHLFSHSVSSPNLIQARPLGNSRDSTHRLPPHPHKLMRSMSSQFMQSIKHKVR